MAQLQDYDYALKWEALPIQAREYTLWVLPIKDYKPKQLILTDNVVKGDTEIKLISSNDEFIISETDLINFNGKYLIVKETTKVLTTETTVKIEGSAFDIPVDSFTVTFGLIPVLADSNSSFNTSVTTAKTINEDTSIYGLTAVTGRSLEIKFTGAMIASDRLNYIMNQRQQYYFEYRNPIYRENRLGTYRGIGEGVISISGDEIINFNGELLSKGNVDDWVPEINENPNYCPYLPSFKINYSILPQSDYANYCPLEANYLYEIV